MSEQKPAPHCSRCGEVMEWGTTTFKYNDIGITIPNVPAWVCSKCGEVSFTPETTDQLIETLKEFVATARRARQRQPLLREYVVQVTG
jgi:YgiT-type zinc finger domain-containing protein